MRNIIRWWITLLWAFLLGMIELFLLLVKNFPSEHSSPNPHIKPNDASFLSPESQNWLRNCSYAKLINPLFKSISKVQKYFLGTVRSVSQQLAYLCICASTSVSCGQFHLKPFPIGGTDGGTEFSSLTWCFRYLQERSVSYHISPQTKSTRRNLWSLWGKKKNTPVPCY